MVHATIQNMEFLRDGVAIVDPRLVEIRANSLTNYASAVVHLSSTWKEFRSNRSKLYDLFEAIVLLEIARPVECLQDWNDRTNLGIQILGKFDTEWGIEKVNQWLDLTKGRMSPYKDLSRAFSLEGLH